MEKEKVYIDIEPISKGKRVLIFLGDLLINFCISVFLFTLVIFNISSAIVGYKNKLTSNLNTINQRYDILYKSNLLTYETNQKYNFDNNLISTFNVFLKYYCLNEEKDYILDYLNSINLTKDEINSIYKESGEKYFDFNEEITLKDNYIELFSPKFSKTDSLSSQGEIEYLSMKENFFTSLFNTLLEKILVYDLKINDVSYIELTNELNEFNLYTKKFNTINIYISFFLSSLITYLLIPLIFKDRSTLTMKIAKVNRINIKTNEFLKRSNYLIISLNNILMNTSIIFFIGMVYIGFSAMFSYTSLLFLSLIGLLYMIINLLFLQFNKLNRSINELATNSIYISKSSLDMIYKAKGY